MTEWDFFTPCPGCGEIGFSVMEFEETEGGEIQLMRCGRPASECRVSGYYPTEANA